MLNLRLGEIGTYGRGKLPGLLGSKYVQTRQRTTAALAGALSGAVIKSTHDRRGFNDLSVR